MGKHGPEENYPPKILQGTSINSYKDSKSRFIHITNIIFTCLLLAFVSWLMIMITVVVTYVAIEILR